MPSHSSPFPRNFRKNYPWPSAAKVAGLLLRMAGVFWMPQARAAVISIGHGVAEIGQAMAEQSSQARVCAYFAVSFRLCGKTRVPTAEFSVPNFHNGGRVYFTSGGSEAAEPRSSSRGNIIWRPNQTRNATCHLAPPELPRQHTRRDVRERQRGAARRLSPLLPEWGHIEPCFPYHGAGNLADKTIALACAKRS